MILIEKLARCSIRCIPNEMEEERARVKIIRQEGKKNGDAIVRRVLSLVWTSKLSTPTEGGRPHYGFFLLPGRGEEGGTACPS